MSTLALHMSILVINMSTLALHMSIFVNYNARDPFGTPSASFVIPLFRKFPPTNPGFCVIPTARRPGTQFKLLMARLFLL